MTSTVAEPVGPNVESAGAIQPPAGRYSAAWFRNRNLEKVFLLYIALALLLFPATFIHLVSTDAQRMAALALITGFIAFRYSLKIGMDQRFPPRARAYIRDVGPTAFACHAALAIGLAAFGTFKVNIANVLPFYADPYIASIDQWLLGSQAWLVAHQVPDRTGLVVDFVYSRLWFAVLAGSFTLAVLLQTGAHLRRYLWSLLMVFTLIGTVLALLGSSVGPIFYDEFYGGMRFAELTRTLHENPDLYFVRQYADYLLTAQRAGIPDFGTGISAMPSVHVAVAVLVALYMGSVSRRLAPLGWLYAAFILYGSVYTGWHYLIDGCLSALLTGAIWVVVSRSHALPLLAPPAGKGPAKPVR